jgi:hypothetical protein
VASLDHRREQEPGQVHHGRHVDLHHVELALERQCRELAQGSESGIVDEDIDFGAVGVKVVKDACWSPWLRQVGREDLRLSFAGLSQVLGQILKQLAFAGYQDQTAPLTSEALGQLESNP